MMHFPKRISVAKISLAIGVALLVGCSNGSDSVDADMTDTGDDTGMDGSGDGTDGGTDEGTDGSGDENGNGSTDDVVCSDSTADLSVLSAIGSQSLESDPIAVDVTSLQATLASLPNACAQAEPLPVVQDDTVENIIQLINAQG